MIDTVMHHHVSVLRLVVHVMRAKSHRKDDRRKLLEECPEDIGGDEAVEMIEKGIADDKPREKQPLSCINIAFEQENERDEEREGEEKVESTSLPKLSPQR